MSQNYTNKPGEHPVRDTFLPFSFPWIENGEIQAVGEVLNYREENPGI